MRTLLILCFCLFGISAAGYPYTRETRTSNTPPCFEQAYTEMAAMLDGKAPLSIKRAVFLQEWAYLDGKLDYKDYCSQIKSTAEALARFMQANNLQIYRTGGNYALFEYFTRPYSMNDHKPFTYDFDDFSGSEDQTKVFVTKVMRTHSGQCHSLPLYYKVLAEAIGAEAHITIAPQHLFIRHRDEQNSPKWVNVELTTQCLGREIFYIENFGISADAIRNKAYLYPLSDKETVAYLLSELTVYYRRKFQRHDDFMLKCVEKSLRYFPSNLEALFQKGDILNMRLINYLKRNGNRMDGHARSLDSLWLKNNAVLRGLGWSEMPDSIYRGLLKGVESDMKSKGFDSLFRKQAIEKLEKDNNKY